MWFWYGIFAIVLTYLLYMAVHWNDDDDDDGWS